MQSHRVSQGRHGVGGRMVLLDDRALAVFAHAWSLLPTIKSRAYLTAIGTDDLGARNGSYIPDDGCLAVNSRLFGVDVTQSIPLFDIQSNDPPRVFPCVSRALATTLHEMAHAIGAGTGLDSAPAWLALSGFVQAWDTPNGTSRYEERRPGWDMGASEWRFNTGAFFLRPYSSKSPHEDFSDCCTHIALGWTASFTNAAAATRTNALAKLAYLRREVWGERGIRSVQVAAQRWHAQRQPRRRDVSMEEVAIIAAILAWMEEYPLLPLVLDGAIDALALAVGPMLVRSYAQRWRMLSDEPMIVTAAQLAAIQRAAMSYVTTTQRQQSSPLLRISAQARARQMARTELHRAQQAATQATMESRGHVQRKVWRTTSKEPCSFCVALDGTSIPVHEAFFQQGESVMDARGKSMTLDYETVMHPPMHPSCLCIMEEG